MPLVRLQFRKAHPIPSLLSPLSPLTLGPDLTKEVSEAVQKGRELVARGAPAELLVASMAEQYPMMAMYAEEMVLNKQGLTREQVLAAVEKFEKDEELDKLLSDITGLSEMFNVLKDEKIEQTVWRAAFARPRLLVDSFLV